MLERMKTLSSAKVRTEDAEEDGPLVTAAEEITAKQNEAEAYLLVPLRV